MNELTLTREELIVLANALNEVLHASGLGGDDFHARLGASRDEAEALLGRINALLAA